MRPEDRYASARALAEDVERWLADEPVSAHRDGLAAAAGPLGRGGTARRSPAPPRLLTAAIVALAVGTVLIGRESAHREAQRRLAVSQLRPGPRRRRSDALAGRRGRAGRRPPDGGRPPRAAGRRPAVLRGVRPPRGDDPSLRLELGRALIRLAQVQELLGDPSRPSRPIAGRSRRSGPAAASAAARADLARAGTAWGCCSGGPTASARPRPSCGRPSGCARPWPASRPPIPDARQALAEGRYHLGASAGTAPGPRARGRADLPRGPGHPAEHWSPGRGPARAAGRPGALAEQPRPPAGRRRPRRRGRGRLPRGRRHRGGARGPIRAWPAIAGSGRGP